MALLTVLRQHLATREDRIVTAITVLLLLALGYLAGLWSAETRKETPIVFQSAASDGTSDILTDDDLRALIVSPSPSTTHAGALQKGSVTAGGRFVGSVNGSKYYFSTCSDIARIKEENRIWFASEAEAKAAGYEASACVTKERANE